MTPEAWALIIPAGLAAVGSVWAGAKALQAAYRSAVNRRAAEMENERLAAEARETVAELEAEAAECKAENIQLWSWLRRERAMVEELRARLDGDGAS